MIDLGDHPLPHLFHGVRASAAIGILAGACAWLLDGIGPSLTISYTRLDQLAALTIGTVVGSTVLAARAFRRRGDVLFDAGAGALLGGVGALVGVSLLAFIHVAATPRVFLVERIAAWALSCAGATVSLAWFAGPKFTPRIRDSALIAFGGGAIAGVIYTLPGASDVWQAIAMLWVGATIGFAIAGPESWHATAVIELLPERDGRWHPLRLREWPVDDGDVLALGEAQLACQGGRVALYPPAGGVFADGHTVRVPRFIDATGVITVGRARYLIEVKPAP
jgi:hypothetical protein